MDAPRDAHYYAVGIQHSIEAGRKQGVLRAGPYYYELKGKARSYARTYHGVRVIIAWRLVDDDIVELAMLAEYASAADSVDPADFRRPVGDLVDAIFAAAQ